MRGRPLYLFGLSRRCVVKVTVGNSQESVLKISYRLEMEVSTYHLQVLWKDAPSWVTILAFSHKMNNSLSTGKMIEA
jgi:hypothetical protein